jgi:GDP-L-fucose synthase
MYKSMQNSSKILITGASGLLGNALSAELRAQGYNNLIHIDKSACNLLDFSAVKSLFLTEKPDYVFHLAAAVFGIGGNLKNRGMIFLDNILMNTYVVEACHLANVKKVIAMGTIAAYAEPKTEIVSESMIWDGPPHSVESSYGHAKRTMLAQLLAYQENYGMDFAYPLSTNLYGPHDKFDSQFGHVIPSLIRKFYDAKKANEKVTVWGDGSASRDFLYAKDAAAALILIANNFTGVINMASGNQTKIADVVNILADHLNMKDDVIWDKNMPNGRKYYSLDLNKLKQLNFVPSVNLKEGLIETFDWYSKHVQLNQVRH